MDPGSTSIPAENDFGGKEVVPMGDERFVIWAVLSVARLAAAVVRLALEIVERRRRERASKEKEPGR